MATRRTVKDVLQEPEQEEIQAEDSDTTPAVPAYVLSCPLLSFPDEEEEPARYPISKHATISSLVPRHEARNHGH